MFVCFINIDLKVSGDISIQSKSIQPLWCGAVRTTGQREEYSFIFQDLKPKCSLWFAFFLEISVFIQMTVHVSVNNFSVFICAMARRHEPAWAVYRHPFAAFSMTRISVRTKAGSSAAGLLLSTLEESHKLQGVVTWVHVPQPKSAPYPCLRSAPGRQQLKHPYLQHPSPRMGSFFHLISGLLPTFLTTRTMYWVQKCQIHTQDSPKRLTFTFHP